MVSYELVSYKKKNVCVLIIAADLCLSQMKITMKTYETYKHLFQSYFITQNLTTEHKKSFFHAVHVSASLTLQFV